MTSKKRPRFFYSKLFVFAVILVTALSLVGIPPQFAILLGGLSAWTMAELS